MYTCSGNCKYIGHKRDFIFLVVDINLTSTEKRGRERELREREIERKKGNSSFNDIIKDNCF